MTIIGVVLASATLWSWRWEMGSLAEGGAPRYVIAAFVYGDLKILGLISKLWFWAYCMRRGGDSFLGNSLARADWRNCFGSW